MSASVKSHQLSAEDSCGDSNFFTIECKGFRRDSCFLRFDARPYVAERHRTVADLSLEAFIALGWPATGHEALFMHDRGWWKTFPDEFICDLFDEKSMLLLVSDPLFDPPLP